MKLFFPFKLCLVPFLFVVSGIKVSRPSLSAVGMWGEQLTVEALPSDLVEIGVHSFGSLQRLREVLFAVKAESILNISGHSVKLLSGGTDNTLPRLANEMGEGKDRYGIQRVVAKSGTIIDVGSNIGDMAISAALVHPTLQIVALEPSPPTFFFLSLNLWLNKIQILTKQDLVEKEKAGVFALNAAVTKDGRNVEIRWADDNTQNAAIDTVEESTEEWRTATVPSVEMSQFVLDHKIKSIELFKIDCEGCEFEVIPSMSTLFLDLTIVKRVEGEIHQSAKNPAETTNARHATNAEIQALDGTLQSRGCEVGAWDIHC